MAVTYDGDNNRIFQISDASSSSKVHQDSSLKSEWKSENGNSYPWENGNGNGGNGTGHSNTGNGGTTNGGGHNHTGNNSDGLKHANCKQCVDTQEAFVQSLADDAVSIDGTDYLPVGKPNSYKDYELIYYINDVTIDNEEVLVEYGAAGTATGTYEYGLQRLSVEHVNEAKEYYLYNGTGNVTQTTAENGSMFLRYTYDAFGNISSIRAPMTVDIDDLNRYTYNGEDYDYNTGLQYLRARYYSTSAGSFISQDTYLGQIISPLSQNRYTYAGNNPMLYNDPSGHIWHVLAGAIVGAVIGATSAAIGSVVTYAVQKAVDPNAKFDWRGLGESMLTGAVSGAASGAVFAATGSTTLAGAAGGAVGGAMNGFFKEVNYAKDCNVDFSWKRAGANALDGTWKGAVVGGVSGLFGGVAGGFNSQIIKNPFASTVLTGTATSIVGGMISRAIDEDKNTKVFSLSAIGIDAANGALSSAAGYGIYSGFSKMDNSFGTAVRRSGAAAKDSPEAKLGRNLADKLRNANVAGNGRETQEYTDNAIEKRDRLITDLIENSTKSQLRKHTTVVGGTNVETGESIAQSKITGASYKKANTVDPTTNDPITYEPGMYCSEDMVVDALGGDSSKVIMTPAIRPRTGEVIPVCPTCEARFGRDAFTPGTTFESDNAVFVVISDITYIDASNDTSD